MLPFEINTSIRARQWIRKQMHLHQVIKLNNNIRSWGNVRYVLRKLCMENNCLTGAMI